MKTKIIEHMKRQPYVDKKGRVYAFGEYFPTELSAYGYNETFGFFWYPKTKEEVLEEGWHWNDPQKKSYEVTLKPADIPDHIKDVPDSILQETIGCAHADPPASGCNEQCTRAFRISPEELSLYRDMRIALPRLCPNCRNFQRIRWRNGYDLFARKCMCEGTRGKGQITYNNTSTHFHGDVPCTNTLETTFSPEKPEIIYCDACYKAEFL